MMKEVKDAVKRADWERLIKKCEEKVPLIAELGREKKWIELWNKALNLGQRHTRGL